MRTLLVTLSLLSTIPAYAGGNPWVLIYANDGKVASPAEIYEHEMGHVLCPWWHHPRGMDPTTGKAYRPPVQCRDKNRLRVELLPQGVSTAEARDRCAGWFHRQPEKTMIGCAFPIDDE